MEDFAPPRPEQPGEADDLAGRDGKADVPCAMHGAGMAGNAQSTHFKHGARAGGNRMGGEQPLQALTRHGEDEMLFVELRPRDLGCHLPVPQHRRPVADGEDFGQPMGDVDHGDALHPEPAQHREQRIDLGARERGGGLVEHEHAWPGRKRTGDHHQVPLRRGQRGDDGARIDGEPEILEYLAGARLHGAALDDDALAEAGAAGEDVLGHRELLEHFDFLRHVADARGGRPGRRGEAHRPAGQHDLARERAGRVHAVENLHQRRLAGAVLAKQRVDLARTHGDVDAAQRVYAAEALDDAAHVQQRLGCGCAHGGSLSDIAACRARSGWAPHAAGEDLTGRPRRGSHNTYRGLRP